MDIAIRTIHCDEGRLYLVRLQYIGSLQDLSPRAAEDVRRTFLHFMELVLPKRELSDREARTLADRLATQAQDHIRLIFSREAGWIKYFITEVTITTDTERSKKKGSDMEIEEKELAFHEVVVRPHSIRVIRLSYFGIRGIMTEHDEEIVKLAFKNFLRHSLPHRGLPSNTTDEDLRKISRNTEAHILRLYRNVHPWVLSLKVEAF